MNLIAAADRLFERTAFSLLSGLAGVFSRDDVGACPCSAPIAAMVTVRYAGSVPMHAGLCMECFAKLEDQARADPLLTIEADLGPARPAV